MKIRLGFVSNSSSASFVIDMNNMLSELKTKILRLTERSHDSTRCTGKIIYLDCWADAILSDDYPDENASIVKSYANKPGIIMIRESDEEMGGCFRDYGFSESDIKPYVLYEFEYH